MDLIKFQKYFYLSWCETRKMDNIVKIEELIKYKKSSIECITNFDEFIPGYTI